MPSRRRSNFQRRQTLDSNVQARLRGARGGFTQFKPEAEREALWNEHGDDNAMFYRRGMSHPIPIEDAEAEEQCWLDSGQNDEYGLSHFFIHKHYSDEEKQALWDDRGDLRRFYWKPGMRQPEPI